MSQIARKIKQGLITFIAFVAGVTYATSKVGAIAVAAVGVTSTVAVIAVKAAVFITMSYVIGKILTFICVKTGFGIITSQDVMDYSTSIN